MPAGDVEVDRLDDDRVDALGDDVLGLGDLVLRVVLGRLHEHLVAGSLGGLLEERHVGVEVAERRLLLQHEGDLLGLARHAVVLRPPACRRREAISRDAGRRRARQPMIRLRRMISSLIMR